MLVALGLGLVGVALGLLYMDFRDSHALYLAMQAHLPTADADAVKAWQKTDRILLALMFGSAGAAAMGAGLMLALFELKAFQKTKQIAVPK